jgi:hypothetical protein
MTYTYPPHYAYPSAPPLYRGIVLVLSIVTLGFFGIIWMLVQSYWVKRVTRDAKPFAWCLAYLLFFPVIFLCAFAGGVIFALAHQAGNISSFTATIQLVTRLGGLGLYVAAAYTLKGALESSPIDIPLGAVMTFLFSATYFQYHLYDYDVEGNAAEQLSGFPDPAPMPPVAVASGELSETPPQI